MSDFSGFDDYIERLRQVRKLSTPSLDGIEDADAYNRRLRENFVRIGALAAENRILLEKYLYPLLKEGKRLSEDEAAQVSSFEKKLLVAENAENLDLPIAELVSKLLYRDAEQKGQMLPLLRRMDAQLSVCYTMMNMTYRLDEYPEIAMHYRNEGFEIGDRFIELRDKENIRRSDSDEARELILTNARFTNALYENHSGDREANNKNLEMLRRDLAISEDPFYLELMPDFDWRYYRYRVLDYFAHATDGCNLRGFDEEDFAEICERTEELWDLWHTDPEYFPEIDKESYVEFHLIQNRYYAKKVTREEYRAGLLKLYQGRDKSLYDVCGIIENIQIPIELLGIIRVEDGLEEDIVLINHLYDNVIAYAFHMPNSDSLSFMLEYSSLFLKSFIELPGGIGFEDIMLDFLAAMHPPTYVHSRMVSQFALCMCRHLIEFFPELLIGVEGCTTAEEVVAKKDEILDFTEHAALCHDTGKIFIIDTVFVYGRKLLDMEFDLIKTHPKMGARILKNFSSTAKYAEVALGHHKWYDNSHGYPEECDLRESPVKTVIDLVLCADCLDAATDTVGRSYKSGKSIDDFLEEIREGSGTRYAPWLVDLLSNQKVREDIEYLLAEGREQIYRDTYQLLKNVHEKEV